MPELVSRAGWGLLVVVAGWLVGFLSAAGSDRLLARDGIGIRPGRAPLLRDVLVQGALAVVWLGLYVVLGLTARAVAAAVLAIPLVQVTVTDLRHRFVYTPVAAGGLLAGLALTPIAHQAAWWSAPAGAVVGGVAFGALYLLGRALYRGEEPLARGDAIIAAMVGAVAGPFTVTALLAGALLSGALALGLLLVRRSGRAFMPYGPGLCLGGLLTLFLG